MLQSHSRTLFLFVTETVQGFLYTHAGVYFKEMLCLSQGVSLKNVSSMLGHASVKMTERYARVLDSSILRDLNAIRDTLNLEREL